MAEQNEQKSEAKRQATLTITEVEGGTKIEVQFSEPYRKGDPSLVQALALGAMEHMRKFLHEQFPSAEDDLRVVKRAKTH